MRQPTLLDADQVPAATLFEIWVPGRSAPQGSKKHVGNGRMVESSKALGPWRKLIAETAEVAMAGQNLMTGAIVMVADFALPRIQAIRKSTPPHTNRPDLDKILRAVGDSLTGVVYVDDSQIVAFADEHEATRKRYAEIGETPGVRIRIKPFEELS